MAWVTARIEQGQFVVLDDVGSLTRLRADLRAAVPVRPSIVTFETATHRVELGLDGDRGFVQGSLRDGRPPYRVTVGCDAADGVVVFFLHGEHHTEIPARHLVCIDAAWAAVTELLVAGTYATSIRWGDV